MYHLLLCVQRGTRGSRSSGAYYSVTSLGETLSIFFDTEKLFFNYLFTFCNPPRYPTDVINCVPITMFSFTYAIVNVSFLLGIFSFSCVFVSGNLLCPSIISSNIISVFFPDQPYKGRVISLVCSVLSLHFLVALYGLLFAPSFLFVRCQHPECRNCV